ncbi:putative serine esterase-domain-containing protein [Thermothelomyces heterothallicus CBS 202.75]|uniref:putative serine esterase-domain-containing protein n=1 Tax=Thermothelomyces heterothallicus CBS 202.75 TaxID=1149848 RepID=UPI0037434A5E
MAAGSDPSSYSGGSLKADHLCVLVHGLWGNPNHMASVAKALRAQHPPDRVYILLAKSNSGSFTYDGIELGGERVCHEIEEELDMIRARGGSIKKLSIVGYSLGGLVARYAIGLLFARGVLDNLECLNFTAFASPFLGVRTPLRGWHNHMWNVLGARTLCTSGRQLFGIDKFRDTGKPLLAVLADPSSIFMSGLARFKRHTLYTNIVNDRSAVFYTTGISKTDPFVDLTKVRVRYLKGYEDVILDPADPVSPIIDDDTTTTTTTTTTKTTATAIHDDLPVTKAAAPATAATAAVAKETAAVAAAAAALRRWARRAPMALVLAVLVPLGTVAFLLNSAVQTARSARRVRLHERGLGGVPTGAFRGVDLFIREVRGAVEDAYVDAAGAAEEEYLLVNPPPPPPAPAHDRRDEQPDVEADDDGHGRDEEQKEEGEERGGKEEEEEEKEEGEDSGKKKCAARETERSLAQDVAGGESGSGSGSGSGSSPFPTLALAAYQFAAIDALDQLGWRKYPVWIHKHNHSHAAMIVRMEKPGFEEGRLVLKHWVTEEFLV